MLMLALLAVAAVSPGDGKTMASDDWQQLAIYGVGGGGGGPLYLQVHTGDLDGDGVPDDAILKLVCADGQVTQALLRRETSGLGSESERRQHAPVTFVKEWGAATPQLMAAKPTYDVKTMKGNERVAADGWTQLSLGNAEGLCGAAAAAVVKTKTKSNQSND